MRAFWMSIAAAAVISIAAVYILDGIWQQTSDTAFTSATNVRFPHQENSHNLVGKTWQSARDH
jgi:hypothetical protein